LNQPFQGKTLPSNCLSHGAAWMEVVLAYLLGEKGKQENSSLPPGQNLNLGHLDYE
jgi:hypothetical protein